MNCPKCKAIITNKQAAFCPTCGEKLADEKTLSNTIPAASPEATSNLSASIPNQRKSRKKQVILGIGIGIIFIVILCSVLLNNAGNGISKSGSATDDLATKATAISVLNHISAIEPILVETGSARDISIGDVLFDMFEEPAVTVKCREPGDTSRMRITFSGLYRPEPSGSYYLDGSVTYDIVGDKASLKSSKGVTADSISYYALCMSGYY